MGRSKGEHLKRFIRIPILLLALLLLTNDLGNLRYEFNNLFILLLLAGFVFTYLPFRLRRKNLWRGILAALAFIAATLLPSWGTIPRLMAFPFFLFFFDLTLRGNDRYEGELPVLLLTSVLFAFFIFAYQYIPQIWQMEQEVALFLSRCADILLGRGLLLGSNAAGVHILLLFAFFYLSLFLLSERRKNLWLPAILLLSILFAEVAYIVIHFPLATLLLKFVKAREITHLHSQIIFFLLACLPTYFYFRRTPVKRVPLFSSSKTKPLIGFGLLILSLILLVMPQSQGTNTGEILLYDKGYLNWRTPVFGYYGDRSGGMFGYLPKYLEMRGYKVKKALISEEGLREASTLVVINLMERFSEEESKIIWDFVAKGGSLLALGDHTAVKGIRDPFNRLLRPVKIEFNFDCAQNNRRAWINTMEFFKHPINYGIGDESQVQVWIGASLSIHHPAKPVIVGRYAFSDMGNLFNTKGAFLGDRRYSPGERLGDVILVAEAKYGKGKVMVFGDTSPFQNGALVKSHDFVDRVFDWLTKEESSDFLSKHRLLISLLLFLGAIFALFLSPASVALMAGGTLLLVVSPISDYLYGRGWEGVRLTGNIAHIDRSHGELFDLMSWQDKSVGGFEYNLMRNGFFPLMISQFSSKRLPESKIFVLFSPMKPFSAKEIKAIDGYVDAGGFLMLSIGWEERLPSWKLLQHFNLDIEDVPLGPGESLAYGQKVRFHCVYPIRADTTQVEVIAKRWGYPVMVYKRIGAGGVFLVADSHFFFNENLEGRKTYHLGNIMFIKELIERKVKGEKRGAGSRRDFKTGNDFLIRTKI